MRDSLFFLRLAGLVVLNAIIRTLNRGADAVRGSHPMEKQ